MSQALRESTELNFLKGKEQSFALCGTLVLLVLELKVYYVSHVESIFLLTSTE